MAIVLFLGQDVKEYTEKKEEMLGRYISEGGICCEFCTKSMRRHSSYTRGIKETGEKLEITLVHCRDCVNFHALLPDFILPHKQYGANEIEGVVIDGQTLPVTQIDTAASESTARRWIRVINENLKNAISILKYLFETSLVMTDWEATAYGEMEQVLFMAPERINTSGNRLGWANIWLGTHIRSVLI